MCEIIYIDHLYVFIIYINTSIYIHDVGEDPCFSPVLFETDRFFSLAEVGSSFSALRQPSDAAVDVLDATLAAGVAASDADANARGELCAIHALASTMVGMRDVPFPVACRVLLPPVLRVWADEEERTFFNSST